MEKGKDRRIPAQSAATMDDVARAVESLSSTDLRRLKRFAEYFVRGLGRAAAGRTAKDLLQEAFASTAIGAAGGDKGRRWETNRIGLTEHLFGAMKSIASHWEEAFDQEEWSDADAARENDAGETVRPVEQAVSTLPDAFRAYSAKQQIAAIEEQLSDSEDAQLVLEGWKEGMTGPEMVAKLGLTEKQVDAAIKLIRYRIKGIDSV